VAFPIKCSLEVVPLDLAADDYFFKLAPSDEHRPCASNTRYCGFQERKGYYVAIVFLTAVLGDERVAHNLLRSGLLLRGKPYNHEVIVSEEQHRLFLD